MDQWSSFVNRRIRIERREDGHSLDALRVGLAALAVHFGFTTHRAR